MYFRFDQYQFDCQQLILTKNGTLIPLNEKPARLLAFFLQSGDKILSKAEILENVWCDRIVTDQVVFQNISYLRSLFGNDAIRTFSKKGYQWQRPSVQITATDRNDDQINLRVSSPSLVKLISKKRLYLLVASISLVLFLLVLQEGGHTQRGEPDNTRSQVHNPIYLIPFTARFTNQLVDEIHQHNHTLMQTLDNVVIAGQAPEAEMTAASFFNSPYMLRKQLINNDNEIVITGFIYPRNYDNIANGTQQYLLEYLIQGQYRLWQGYLLASTVPELTMLLEAQTQRLQSSQFFTLQADAFATSELSLLYGEDPDNLDILKHLIERLIKEDNFDVASARITQMATLSQKLAHPTYSAYAAWFRGQLMLKRNQLAQALTQLTLASDMMASASMLSLQSEINKSLAEIAVTQQDFKQVQEYLFQSASQARLANRPVQEIRAYTLLSIYASKLGFEEEQYEYLYQAKTLLADYSLDGSHYMLPFYHFALFESDVDAKIRKYQWVLEQPVTPQNYWVFFSATSNLVRLYILQEKWQEALALAANVTETGRSASLSAMIWQAKGEPERAIEFAKTAFNSAGAQQLDWLGLNMALLLLELYEQQQDAVAPLRYKRFIQQTAHHGWLQRHQERLANVGIDVQPDGSYAQNR